MTRIAKLVHQPQTDADVQLLLAHFAGILPDGRLIAHAEIEEVIHLRRHESRYHAVTKHWRRVLFEEQRVFLDGRSAEGHGFKALTPDEMVRFANREVRAIGRRLKRALLVAASPSDDEIQDPNNRVYRARLISGTQQMAQAHARVIRELSSALKPQRQLRAVANASSS